LKPLAWYKNLSNGRTRRESGCFLVEGKRAVEQIRSVAPRSLEELLVTDKTPAECRNYSCAVRVLTDRQFKTICSSKTPQGIAAVVRTPENSYSNELPHNPGDRLLLLEGLQDPGNVGTLIRTAAAFDFSGVVLSAECADPFSPKAIQASAGSIMSVWIRRTNRYFGVAKELKKKGYKLIAADVKGETLTPGYSLPSPCVIMLGSEGKGLSDQLLVLAGKKIRIPMNDSKTESLNVAVSGAILMYLIIKNN
jgi:TrmH family RNA methyltransferase